MDALATSGAPSGLSGEDSKASYGSPAVDVSYAAGSGEVGADAAAVPEPGAAPFVNEGLLRWERQRKTWRETRREPSGPTARRRRSAKPVDAESIVEVILFTAYYPSFPRPVRLSNVVDVLVELWEEDGLYG